MRLIEEAVAAARDAGRAVLEHYAASASHTRKDDGSPVTAADRAAHECIVQHLRRVSPEVPVLSEEGRQTIAYDERKLWPRFWIIDPLDGTKEFLKRTGEFTVNIALVEAGRPVLGVVYAPVLGWLYRAAPGEATVERPSEPPRPVRSRRADVQHLSVVASRDHAGPAVAAMLARLPKAQTRSMGSSLKFCLVAEGEADLYLRDVPTMEWDTAAAQCILEAAGGLLLTLDGEPLAYNKPDLRNPALVSVGDPTLDWQELVGARSQKPAQS